MSWEARLCDIYERWLEKNPKVPQVSADEARFELEESNPIGFSRQIAWLKRFDRVWWYFQDTGRI